MKCKNHPADLSSTVGVCASCLRHRLFVLVASQSQSEIDDPDEPDVLPHPPRFPPSVSPPVGCHRKSSSYDHPVQRPHRHRRRFFSTPQVGPAFSGNPNPALHEPSDFLPEKKKPSRFSLLNLLLRKGSEKVAGPNPTTQPTSSSSTSIFSLWKKKKPQPSPFTGSAMSGSAHRRKCSAVVSNLGMSPAGGSGEDEDPSPCNSGCSSEDCPHSWRRTPASSAAFVTPRRATTTTTPHHPRSRSGFTFCLSPLVRTNTGGNWKNKGVMPSGETGYSGSLADAAPLRKNRSRKLADFGRGEYWR